MSKLVCLSGMNKGDEFVLKEGSNKIGRHKEAEVVLFDAKCSRSHCCIEKRGKYYSIEDLRSRNGTRLDGHLVEEKSACEEGQKIRIGNTILMISEKPVGSAVDQIATEVAAERHDKCYKRLLERTAREVGDQSTKTIPHKPVLKRLQKWLKKEQD